MKTKKRLRVLAVLMTMAMVFTMMPLAAQKAYAKGDSPAVVKSGDLYNFAKDAPITTVRIDGSKLTKDNAVLTYQMNAKYSNNKFEWGETSAGNRDCVVINDLTTEDTSAGDDGVMQPGSFTLTYKDAAIMRDGTKRDFSATYTPEIRMQKNTEPYTDSFTIMAFQSRKPGVTIQPLSKFMIHFGLIVNITCQVVDADKEDTFLLVSDEINSARTSSDFQNIVYAASNNNYGEAINFVSGVDGESDVYLPGESTLNTSPSDITGKNGYQVRFLATGADRESLNHVAAVASASGIQAKIWSSGGVTDYPVDLYYLDATKDVFTKEHTSSSGEGGKIELWTDGLTHNSSVEARKLAGGTIAKPHTYAVPYGKEVTYRMTPEEGYILDKLYVNGSETNPTNTVYKVDSTEIDYYEYHFDSDSVNSDQEISVTWKKYAATTNPIPVRKVITGSAPDKDQEFTVVLESVSVLDAPVDGPASSNVDKISVKVVKGQTKVDSEIPALTFKKPGEYVYNVRELKENASGYTYDDKVYTVKFVIEPNPDDTDTLVCTKQTILDGEKEVDVCEFVNNYERHNEPTPTKAVTTVTINSATVSAKTLDVAVKKAAGNKDSVTTIVLGKKVKKISKGAFKKYKKANTLVVKTKKLKKSKVKKSLKGSKITKIKVKVGKKKVNKKYVKKYKKIFTKKNAGKKVKVTL